MPERRKMGSLSLQRVLIRRSASSSRPYIVSAIPTARPRRIFSCWVSWAYCKTKAINTLKNKSQKHITQRNNSNQVISTTKTWMTAKVITPTPQLNMSLLVTDKPTTHSRTRHPVKGANASLPWHPVKYPYTLALCQVEPLRWLSRWERKLISPQIYETKPQYTSQEGKTYTNSSWLWFFPLSSIDNPSF